MMERWQKFLDSLGSKGGNIFVLSFFVVFLLVLTIRVEIRGDAGQAATVLLSTFSGFAGALLGILSGSGGTRKTDVNGNANGATKTP